MFSCVCGKHYKRLSGLNTHKLTCQNIIKEETCEVIETPLFTCVCKKTFTSKPGLSRHRKKNCKKLKEKDPSVEELIKIVNQQKQSIDTLLKQITMGITINNTIIDNSNNVVNVENFNLQTYLHETCKDVPTYEDYVEMMTGDQTEIAMLFLKGHATVESITNAIFEKSLKKQKYMSAYLIDNYTCTCIKKVSRNKWLNETEDNENQPVLEELTDLILHKFKSALTGFKNLDVTDTTLFENEDSRRSQYIQLKQIIKSTTLENITMLVRKRLRTPDKTVVDKDETVH